MPAAYSTGFDAHTHLDDPAFDHDRDEVIARARAAGVGGFAIAGADPASWSRVRAVAEAVGAVAVLGLHPWWVAGLEDPQLDQVLAALPDQLTPHGLGETGLDAHRAADRRAQDRQRHAFRVQLDLARSRDLPVVLHGAGAWPEVVRTVQERGLSSRGGMAHAWTGSAEVARQAVTAGLSLSFGTDLRRSRRARAAIVAVPTDRLLLETDAPDRPWIGERGEPAHLIDIAAEAAALRGERVEDLLAYTSSNARRLFGVQEGP